MWLTYWRQGACVLGAFVALALVQSWPLPLHLGTHLTGSPGGDTGVYVWNLWIFRHQLVTLGATPFQTLEILPLDGPTDLGLHNYTLFSNLLSLPLLNWLDVVTAFNLVYLINVALAGLGMFLLARRLTGRTAEALVAGLFFAWSPFLATRGTAHFSLVAAAPLPLFALMLDRAWDSQRVRDAVGAGAVLAWAALCDPYYAIYCLFIAAAFLASRILGVTFVRRPLGELRGARQLVNVACIALGGLVIGVHVLGGGTLDLQVVRLSMHTLYTPMLLLTVLVCVRLALALELQVRALPLPPRAWLMRAAVAAGVAAAILASPTIYAAGSRLLGEGGIAAPVLWRSSARGLDLLAFLQPNPNHALAPAAIADWLSRDPIGYHDQVAALSWTGLLVTVAAWRWAGVRPPRFWLWFTVGSALLALGPFLHVAGINTYIPTPWSIVRYLPIVGAARMPSRLAILTTMGFGMLVAYALAALGRQYPARRRLILTTVAAAMAFELLPAPRVLYSAGLPAVYERIRDDPRPVRVLELPTGVRDGLSSYGDFTARAQFYQALHGKGLVGGYLSRVARRPKDFYRRMPVTHALIEVSEGRKLDRRAIDRAIDRVDDFVRATRLGYVVMDTARVTDDLRDFATILFGLRKIAEADGYELYVPRSFD